MAVRTVWRVLLLIRSLGAPTVGNDFYLASATLPFGIRTVRSHKVA